MFEYASFKSSFSSNILHAIWPTYWHRTRTSFYFHFDPVMYSKSMWFVILKRSSLFTFYNFKAKLFFDYYYYYYHRNFIVLLDWEQFPLVGRELSDLFWFAYLAKWFSDWETWNRFHTNERWMRPVHIKWYTHTQQNWIIKVICAYFINRKLKKTFWH